MQPVALTIAGSDPSGGAGLQADLKTFHQFGVYGEAVITLVTVQNTVRVSRVECLDPDLVLAQIRAVLEDIPPHAGKLGALGDDAIVQAVGSELHRFQFPLVVDPVMIGKHGTRLMSETALISFREKILPRAFLLTPNLPEAEAITGRAVDGVRSMRHAAEKLAGMGARSVLVKGGHLSGDATDVLWTDGKIIEFPSGRIDTVHTHGTGCTYSAAITAELARGSELVEAVRRAKLFIARAIQTSPGLGGGAGPVNHWA